jgi:hypothetical protein
MKPIAIFVLKNLPLLAPEIIIQFNITGQELGWINVVEKINKLRAFDTNSEVPLLTIFHHHTSRNIPDPKSLWESHKIVFVVLPPHFSAFCDATPRLLLMVTKGMGKPFTEV